MPRKLKALLIAVLVMVVPVQSIAAMSAGICRALEHHGVVSAHTAESTAPQEAHTGHTGNGMSHEHVAAGTDENPPRLGGHCGDCGACGASATISSINSLSTPDALRSAVRVLEPDSPAGVLPDGLDRPPLTLPV